MENSRIVPWSSSPYHKISLTVGAAISESSRYFHGSKEMNRVFLFFPARGTKWDRIILLEVKRFLELHLLYER